MMKFIDPDHPFYRPLWIRLLIVAVCAIWTAVEFYVNLETTWGMIFLAVTAYTACVLIIFFKPKTTVVEDAKPDDPV
ncbi:hypothetical protein [Rhizobium herbae]|uniref:DUF3329 domain-containing protein n=1 Tax=Rhizobium herbae TaxID=508661 RepID=A0ABS4ETD5_9HYPH|nr:hypothetical protein [Rhizobium herbae]MBP1861209.1 hypothetical protein [Rhizobium herbae]